MPVLIVEVASRHESHHLLMSKLATWFTNPSDVKFALAAKLKFARETVIVELYLFENTNATISLKIKNEMFSAMKSEFDSKITTIRPPQSSIGPEKKHREVTTPINFHSPEDLLECYGLMLVKLVIVDSSLQNLEQANWRLDLGHLLEEVDFEGKEEVIQRDCLIDFSEELKNYFENIKED